MRRPSRPRPPHRRPAPSTRMLRRTKADDVDDPGTARPPGDRGRRRRPDALALLKRLLESTGEEVEAIGDTGSAVAAVVAGPRRCLVPAFGNQSAAPTARRWTRCGASSTR